MTNKAVFVLSIIIALIAPSARSTTEAATFVCDGDSEGVSRSGDLDFDRICIDDVQYLYRSGGHRGYMSPSYNIDGSLNLCKKN